MGTRQEAGIFLLVATLVFLAFAGETGPSGTVPPDLSGQSGRTCPLAAASMTGPRCVLLGMRIPLNLATAQDLQVIPGIGQVLAERIVRHRDEIGMFTSLDGLKQVKGIGPRKVATCARYLTVMAAPGAP